QAVGGQRAEIGGRRVAAGELAQGRDRGAGVVELAARELRPDEVLRDARVVGRLAEERGVVGERLLPPALELLEAGARGELNLLRQLARELDGLARFLVGAGVVAEAGQRLGERRVRRREPRLGRDRLLERRARRRAGLDAELGQALGVELLRLRLLRQRRRQARALGRRQLADRQ